VLRGWLSFAIQTAACAWGFGETTFSEVTKSGRSGQPWPAHTLQRLVEMRGHVSRQWTGGGNSIAQLLIRQPPLSRPVSAVPNVFDVDAVAKGGHAADTLDFH